MTDYRATPEQWAAIEKAQEPVEVVPGTFVAGKDHVLSVIILELRARVEKLERGLKDEADCNRACNSNLIDRIKKLEANSKPTSNGSKIRSSLVAQVACAIDDRLVPVPDEHGDAARRAIKEIAVWLSEHAGGTRAAWLLEREAER